MISSGQSDQTRGPRFRHLGISSSSAKNARNFYGGILGLKQDRSMTISVDMASALFGVEEEIKVVNFLAGDLHVEVFIRPEIAKPDLTFEHICMEVEDMDTILTASMAMGLPVVQVTKPDGEDVVFISDFDGHRFEIKPLPK